MPHLEPTLHKISNANYHTRKLSTLKLVMRTVQIPDLKTMLYTVLNLKSILWTTPNFFALDIYPIESIEET